MHSNMPLPRKITSRYDRRNIEIIPVWEAGRIGTSRAQKKQWRKFATWRDLGSILEDVFVVEKDCKALIRQTVKQAVDTRALVLNKDGLAPPCYAKTLAQCELDLQLLEAQVKSRGSVQLLVHGCKRLAIAQREFGYVKIVTRTLEQKLDTNVAAHVASFLQQKCGRKVKVKVGEFSICPNVGECARQFQRKFMFVNLLERTFGIPESSAKKITEYSEVDDFRFF